MYSNPSVFTNDCNLMTMLTALKIVINNYWHVLLVIFTVLFNLLLFYFSWLPLCLDLLTLILSDSIYRHTINKIRNPINKNYGLVFLFFVVVYIMERWLVSISDNVPRTDFPIYDKVLMIRLEVLNGSRN